VLLARQFSGEALDAGADEVWDALNAGTLDHVRSVRWAGPSAVEQTLTGAYQWPQADGCRRRGRLRAEPGRSAYEGNVYFWAAREIGEMARLRGLTIGRCCPPSERDSLASTR